MEDPLEEALRIAHDILDDEHHDDDCVLRCLRNDCGTDHHCERCIDLRLAAFNDKED